MTLEPLAYYPLLFSIPLEMVTWLSYLYISRKGFLTPAKSETPVALIPEDLRHLGRFVFACGKSHLAMVLFMIFPMLGWLPMWTLIFYVLVMVWTASVSASTALMLRAGRLGRVLS